MSTMTSELAINGGPKSVSDEVGDLFTWPIITKEDEEAALEVLRRGAMSGTDVTEKFEKEYAEWYGTKYALAHNTGTAALHASMWACGVGRGDEIIAPSLTYWATCMPALNLGAAINFTDVEPDTLCMDPADIEHRIGPRTKAIVVVHYCAYPADMDPIMEIARKHNIKVIEDVSHAHGTLYKGRLTGTIGDVGAMSLMTGKSLPIGEAGILVTDNREILERAAAFGHYERTGKSTNYSDAKNLLSMPELVKFSGLPWGGFKYRMHQLSSAVGRVQLKHYKARMQEIDKAMNRFWDLLEGVPGLKAHRPARDSGSTMGGWYAAKGLYRSEELGGLPAQKFCEAVSAEGASASNGANFPLHLHPLFHEADIYNEGKPTMLANTDRDIRQGPGSLPVTEAATETVYTIPWFKHDRPELIEQHANAFRKVAENADKVSRG